MATLYASCLVLELIFRMIRKNPWDLHISPFTSLEVKFKTWTEGCQNRISNKDSQTLPQQRKYYMSACRLRYYSSSLRWREQTYLNNIWEEIWVEMRPVNPSYVNNHFNKLVSNVCWKLLVVRQKIFIEKLTDLSLISRLCSYPLFIDKILWKGNERKNFIKSMLVKVVP